MSISKSKVASKSNLLLYSAITSRIQGINKTGETKTKKCRTINNSTKSSWNVGGVQDCGWPVECRYHYLIDSCYDAAWSEIASFGVWFSKRNSQSHIGLPWNQFSCLLHQIWISNVWEPNTKSSFRSIRCSQAVVQAKPDPFDIGMLIKYEYTVNSISIWPHLCQVGEDLIDK